MGPGRRTREWIPDQVRDDMGESLVFLSFPCRHCHSRENGNPRPVISAKEGTREVIRGESMNNYYVYILASKRNGTLYVGITNDLERRVYGHKHGLVPGFTSKYGVTKLVYFEHTEMVDAAIAREKQLKNWHRQWKIELIEKTNAEWRDLSEDWLT